MKEGLGMPKAILIAAMTVFSAVSLLTAEFAVAETAAPAVAGPTGPTDNIAGGKPIRVRLPRLSRVEYGHNGPTILMESYCSAFNIGTVVSRRLEPRMAAHRLILM